MNVVGAAGIHWARPFCLSICWPAERQLGPYQLISGSSGRIVVQCAIISVQPYCRCLTMALKESSKH